MREKILTDAFKRHAKADIHRVDGLMASATTAHRFSRVIMDLVAQYPSMAVGLREALGKGAEL